jgi:hypothetical protein
MAIDKIFNDGNVDGIADNIFNAVNNSVSEVKQMQQRKAAENAQMVVQSLKKIDTDIRSKFDNVTNVLEKRIITIKDGRDGINGKDGRDGKDGKDGRDGKDGKQGPQGLKGKDGLDGLDGVSVSNANIDFDGSLIIGLSNGRELNVGEVVSPDLVEKIKVINTMSTNAAITVKDEGTVLTTSVKSLNFVGSGVTATKTGDDVTVTVAGGGGSGTVTSVSVTSANGLAGTVANATTTPAITLSTSVTGLVKGNGTALSAATAGTDYVAPSGALGTPSSGTLTNATGLPLTTGVTGLLPIANGGTGTATPALVAGTNVTISGSWPNQTINATAGGSGTVTSVAATVPAFLSVAGSPITTTGTLAITLSGTALPVINGGTGVTTSTGTGNVVLSTSPTLVTPNLGTPSALVGTNITGTATSFTASNVTTNANLTGAVTSVGNATSLGSFTSSALATALTDETGSGPAVFATSPTLVTPLLGTPTSVTLTNATGLPISTGVSGLGTGVATALAVNVGSAGAPVVNGGALGTPSSGTATNLTGLPISTGISGLGTGVATFLATPSSANLVSAITDETGSGSLVFANSPTLVSPILGTPTSGTLSSCTVDGTDAVGFRNIPVNSQSVSYTAVLADSGKVIFHPSTDANARTFTIPANSSVAYPIGTAITFINMTSQVVTIAITTDTMYLSSAGTTGSRSLAQYGSATAIKMTSTTWLISGSGLT